MDKFLIKNAKQNNGLDLLINNNIEHKNNVKRKDLSDKLDVFKDIMINKIKNFDPIEKNNSNFNYMLKLMWLEYLTENLTIEKECQIYNSLNLKYDSNEI